MLKCKSVQDLAQKFIENHLDFIVATELIAKYKIQGNFHDLSGAKKLILDALNASRVTSINNDTYTDGIEKDMAIEYVNRLTDFIEAIDLINEFKIDRDAKDLESAKILLCQVLSETKQELRLYDYVSMPLYDKILPNLLDLYDKVIQKVKSDDVKNIICEIDSIYDLTKMSNIMELEQVSSVSEYLDYKSRKLKKEDCPIVVTGYTSSGKSTFINMIAREEIMPEHTLHMTNTLCILYSHPTKRITAKIKKDDNASDQTPDDFQKCFDQNCAASEVKEFLKNMMLSKIKYTCISVYWPLEHLPSTIPIIDTPTLDMIENANLILNAVAVVCVFNASVASSVYSEIPNFFAIPGVKNDLFLLPKPPIFIFNKWDTMPEDVKKFYREKTLSYLRKSMADIYPAFSSSNDDFENNHLFEMSCKKVLTQLQFGIYPENVVSYDYQKFMKEFYKFICEAHINRHVKSLRILQSVTEHIYCSITKQIRLVKMSNEEKLKLHRNNADRIRSLHESRTTLRRDLIDFLNSEKIHMHDRIVNCIYSESAYEEIFQFAMENTSDVDTIESIKSTVVPNMDNLIRSMLLFEKQKLFTEYTRKVDEIVSNEIEQMSLDINIPEFSVMGCMSRSFFLKHWSYLYDALLILSFPVLAPIAYRISIVRLIYVPFVLHRFSELYKYLKTWYNINSKAACLKMLINELLNSKWNKKALEHLDIDDIVNAIIEYRIDFVCDKLIPNIISSLEALNEMVLNSNEFANSSLKNLAKQQMWFKSIIGEMKHFGLCYLKDDPNYILIENIEIGEVIGSGSFGCVNAGSIKDQGLKVAIKFLNSKENTRVFLYFSELDTLRKLQHDNIVKLVGVTVCETSGVPPDIGIVMEFCSGTLEDVFIKKAQAPANYEPSSNRRQETFTYYKSVANQIHKGLDYLHNVIGCVHRDLKLSNIFIHEEKAKLGDFGFCLEQDFISGTFVGTPTHIAPEVFKGQVYTSSADIYAFSIVLWEMWYGEKHSIDLKNGNLEVCQGQRPSVEKPYCPPDDLCALMFTMWSSDQGSRPDIAHVSHVLNKLSDVI